MITQEDIAKIIVEEVRTDIYGDLYNVERAAEIIFDNYQSEILRLKTLLNERYNASSENWHDRMGGCFSPEEILESLQNNW